MFKKIVLIGLLLSSLKSYCQQIYIGQNAGEVNQIVRGIVQNNEETPGLNQVSMQYEPQYNKKGILDNIIQCTQYKFKIRTDFCTSYVIKNDKLEYIYTQFSNTISIQELEEGMPETMIKVGDYYFDNSSQNYFWFHTEKDGSVEEVERNILINPPPVNILKQLNGEKNIPETNFKVDKNLPLTKYVSTETIFVTVDDEQIKKRVLLNISLLDPKITNNTSLNLSSQGYLLIKYSSGKIYKKVYISYIKKEIDQLGTKYSYIILNSVNENDQNTLQVYKWNKPLIIEGKSYSYRFILSKIEPSGSTEGDTMIESNIIK